MTYKLAKQLKDAGFPAPSIAGWCPGIDDDDVGGCGCEAMPSLSQLIEACGDGFYSLTKRLDGMWDAVPNANIGTPFAKTPDEAVARLYLALHTKDS